MSRESLYRENWDRECSRNFSFLIFFCSPGILLEKLKPVKLGEQETQLF